MPVPTGTASLLDIQNEFGGSNPISLDEYYGVVSGVPTSGTISIDDFRGLAASTNVINVFTGTAIYLASSKGLPGYYSHFLETTSGYVYNIFNYPGAVSTDIGDFHIEWHDEYVRIAVGCRAPDGTYRAPELRDGELNPNFVSLTLEIGGFTTTVTPTSGNYILATNAFGQPVPAPVFQSVDLDNTPWTAPVNFSNTNYTLTVETLS